MADLLKGFMRENVGNRISDFYFKMNSKGVKSYYSKITGKRIRREQVPANIINHVQVYDPMLDQARDRAELLKSKDKHLQKIKKLQEKIREIDLKLHDTEDINPENYAEQIKKDDARRQEYKEELRKMFEQFKQKPAPTVNPSILERLGIHDKKSWKAWLIANHPDRGGNTELCEQVIAAGRAQNW